MWFAERILRYRLFILFFLALTTGFMAIQARKVQWSFDMIKIIPNGHVLDQEFTRFKAMFGEDANIMALGITSDSLYTYSFFKSFYELGNKIDSVKGISSVISLAHLPILVLNDSLSRFDYHRLFEQFPENQNDLDSLLSIATQNRIYSGNLFNSKSALILISIEDATLNSIERQLAVEEVEQLGRLFAQSKAVEVHFAGLPYFRTYLYSQVRKEMGMFLLASLLITSVVLWSFFRSFTAVVVPLALVSIVIIWTLGTLSLLGFKITILTGLLPPILVVIGIPNCVYLINKFHFEISQNRSKTEAILTVIKKIGFVTLVTNLTTAIGFAVLVFTGIKPMVEFGIAASLNIMAAFLISLTFLPIVFSYIPAPKERHIKHLEFVLLNRMVVYLIFLIESKRRAVFLVVSLLCVLGVLGASQTLTVAYMLDDVPKSHSLRQDLEFFEKMFGGVMPLEIVINTGSPKGYLKKGMLEKIDTLQTELAKAEALSEPVSIVSLLKACNQAYFGVPEAFQLPSSRERVFIFRYLRNSQDEKTKIASSFLDTSKQYVRISMKMADIGSVRMDSLMNHFILPKIEQIGLQATITGSTFMFIKGNEFLVLNLGQSILLAFLLNALVMGFMFGNIRMVLISLIANMIPMLLTYGLMGLMGIALKPSTAIVFSIAFGIAVDDAIHFLARYKLALKLYRGNVIKAIDISMKETAMSMFYTSVILFFGFVIFAFSSFGGTISLGLLTSFTLLTAMLTNLILLPSILRAFGAKREQLIYFAEELKK
jgi:predicted RND superfamily exporter protein